MPEIKKVIVGQPVAYLADPHLWVDSRAVLSIRFAVFESLVKYDRQAKIVPGLATHWHLAEDAKTWTFHIRPNVHFHDGTLLTAEDAAASIKRAVGPEMPGEYGTAALLALYLQKAEIQVIDTHTLRIVTPEHMADLPDLLLYAVIVPARHIANIHSKVPGTGPYQVSDEKENEIHLRRFENYWAGKSPVESLVFRGIHKPQDRVKAFQNGEVDIITYMSLDFKADFSQYPEAHIIERETPMCVIIMCNAQQGACQDKRVRQALNYATDLEQVIARVVHGSALPLTGPLSPFHSGTDPKQKPYPYDPAKARQLLKEAGFEDGINLTLDRPTISPEESKELCTVLIEQWKIAGIHIHERVHENREKYALMVRDKQIGDMCVFDSSPLSTYRVLREKLNSNFAGPWWEGYHNVDVNRLMETAWGTTDQTKRTQIYRQAFQLIREDAPWLFLYSPKDMWVVRNTIMETFSDWDAGLDGLVLFGQG